MSGALATVRLMFTALPLQRVLLLVGSLSAVVGLGATAAGGHDSASWWVPMLLTGSCILGLSIPPFLGGILLRSLSAPRTVQLIPHGRLQLLIGSLLAELLTASIPALFMVMIAAHGAHDRAHMAAIGHAPAMLFATIFVSIFAAATVAFVTLYYGSASQFGILAPIVVIAIIPIAVHDFPQLQIREFPTSASDLAITLAGALGVWSLFGALYLRAGRIAPSVWGRAVTFGGVTVAPPQWLAARQSGAGELSSQRDAMRVLLTGSHVGGWAATAYPVLSITVGGLFGFALIAGGHRGALEGPGRFLAVMVAYSGGLVSAMAILPMIGRARYLWLKSSLDRRQLFRETEVQSWRTLAILTLAAVSASVLICLLAKLSPRAIGEMLTLPAVAGPLMIYVVLMHTRGWRLADILVTTVLSAIWLLGLVLSVLGLRGSAFLLLLAIQIPLIPVLRAWASARWTRIDWMINRPLQLAQLLGR
jgi:hypothetical protein